MDDTERLGRGLLFVLLGPSGVGKSTVKNYIESSLGAESSPKFTNRPRRNSSEDDRDFIFVSPRDMPVGSLLHFESYGCRFAIQLDKIDNSLRQGRHHVVVAGAGDVAAQLAIRYPTEIVPILVYCDRMTLRERVLGTGSSVRSKRWLSIGEEIDNIYPTLAAVTFVVNNSRSLGDTYAQTDRLTRVVLAAQGLAG